MMKRKRLEEFLKKKTSNMKQNTVSGIRKIVEIIIIWKLKDETIKKNGVKK